MPSPQQNKKGIMSVESTTSCFPWANIFEAAQNGDIESVKDYVENRKVDVNTRLRGSGETALHKATQEGHFDVVKYLVSKGADVNSKDKWGYNALLWATDKNMANFDMIKFLVESGSDLKSADKKNGYTAGHWAAIHDRLDILQYFAQKGMDLSVRTKQDETVLLTAASKGCLDIVAYMLESKLDKYDGDIFAAAKGGHLGILRYFIEKKGVSPTIRDRKNNTPLHIAAKQGKLDIMKYLIEKQHQDLNDRGEFYWTPTMSAASKGQLAVVKYLAEDKKADLTLKCHNGRNALLVAALENQLPVIKYLMDDPHVDTRMVDNYGANVLLNAAASREGPSGAALQYLIEDKKLDSAVKDKKGWNILHCAAGAGNTDGIAYIVEKLKFNVNARDKYGNSPLYVAINNDHKKAAEYLLEHRANLMNQNNDGNTGFHVAAKKNQLPLLRYLMEVEGKQKGTKDFVDVANKDARTPLMEACVNGHLDVVKYLVEEQGASLNVKDAKDGAGLMHHAAASGNVSLVKYLVEGRKMDPNATDKRGDTPFMWASYEGHLDVVKYLFEKKVKYNHVNSEGEDAMHLAAEKGHLDVVKYLNEIGGIDIGVRTSAGENSLDIAKANGHTMVANYLESAFTRNKRSVLPGDGPYPATYAVAYQYPTWGAVSNTGVSGYLPQFRGIVYGGGGNGIGGADTRQINRADLGGVIGLLDAAVRYANGNKYRNQQGDLWNRDGILNNRIDENALHAVHSMNFQ